MLVLFSGNALASLYLRGLGIITSGSEGSGGSYKLIYDDVLDITWLDYTKSLNNWDSQMAWAGALEVTFDDQTFHDWRLPTRWLSPHYARGV